MLGPVRVTLAKRNKMPMRSDRIRPAHERKSRHSLVQLWGDGNSDVTPHWNKTPICIKKGNADSFQKFISFFASG